MYKRQVWTSGEILISTGAGIYIADQTPETHKGRSTALYEFARGIGKLTGPLTSGLLLTRYTYGQSWLVIVCICLAVGAVVWLSLIHISRRNFTFLYHDTHILDR